ncbi:zf-HC2 domain-containing protein [Actinoplanes sp. NPDC049265]|uniref:zf-HC2 domain-containing protein n=1 Tax=Actinoplanes sp. NPDC049265 TaxID=3363902 RepID=UPI0037101FAF
MVADHADHVDELLGAHFAGALDPVESDAVHRHLEICAGCRDSADEVIEVLAALALIE